MDKKIIFVAFAMEDEQYRDYLQWQSSNANAPFEYIDMSVKKAYVSAWKTKVRTRIQSSDGVIALISQNSLTSEGQLWEIKCAKEEGKAVMGLWIHKDEHPHIEGVRMYNWTWENVAKFVDSL